LTVQKKTKSLLDELDTYLNGRSDVNLVEARGNHIIAGAINLLKYIKENFPDQQAQDLEKRLLNSIRSGDASKFNRGIRTARKTK
jgi:hypothetical protein